MTIDLVLSLFSLLFILIVLLGVPGVLGVSRMPKFLRELQLYGKLIRGTQTLKLTQLLLVPKRWFTHFYVLGSAYAVVLLAVVVQYCVTDEEPATWLRSYISAVTSISTSAGKRSVILAIVLFSCHVCRRLYECLAVAKFSNARMNVVHYGVGLVHYWGCFTALSAHFLSSVGAGDSKSGPWLISHTLGFLVFACASYHQHQAQHILAEIRGQKNSNDYKIPHGDWFEYVSCPHYFAEMLIYLSLYVVLEFDTTWLLITCWVVANQILTGIMSHRWYLENFENYPKKRRAVIPFLL